MSSNYRSILNVQGSSFASTNSFTFDGIDDYVSLASRTQNFTDFTISVWFKTTSKGGANAIIGNSSAEGGYLFFIGQSSGVIKFYDSAYRTISGTIIDNAWHHLAVTYDSSVNELKSYIDNQYNNSSIETPILSSRQFSSGSAAKEIADLNELYRY